jgi:hypothetical protein
MLPYRLSIATAGLAALWVLAPGAALAAGGNEAPYVEPLPQGKTYNVFVIGASMADQLATGLKWSLRKDPNLQISVRAKAATGLVRDDVHDWLKAARNLVAEEDIHIAIVALGGNDRQDFFANGRRIKRFSTLWRAEYMKRAALFMNILKQDGAAIYWVGLPIVRSKRMTKDYMLINTYLRDLAKENGIKFIDIATKFRGRNGGYTAFGKDLNNRQRRIRDKDGIHFNMAGARVLGEYVSGTIRQDLKAARQRSQTSELKGTRKN